MNEILKFITDAKTFYIATIEGDKPKVRPFGFIMEHEGKLYFSTTNQNNLFNQLASNPYCEICTVSSDGKWIRLSGKAVFDSRIEVKAKVFDVMPELKNMYKSAENPNLETFYLDEAEATIFSFAEGPKTITL